jgi:hypothetical protein
MLEFFSFRNFRQFERTRHEIRLPYDLLNDLRFRQLSDATKAHVLCLLLVSARMRNLLPNHPVKLERLIGATEPVDIGALSDFIDFPSAEQADFEEVAARKQIPESVRAAVIVRDGGRCRRCGSTRNLGGRSHRGAQPRRQFRRGQSSSAVPSLQSAQVEEDHSAALSQRRPSQGQSPQDGFSRESVRVDGQREECW